MCVCERACVYVCSVVSDSFATAWTVACQAPLSMKFSRQEYWSGLPFQECHILNEAWLPLKFDSSLYIP